MAKTDNPPENDASEFGYILRLFITGTTPVSTRAIVNVRRLCEEHLKGNYHLEVVDILKHPQRAKDEQIIAAPTLVKHRPLPLRRFIGDMSETPRLIRGLDIVSA